MLHTANLPSRPAPKGFRFTSGAQARCAAPFKYRAALLSIIGSVLAILLLPGTALAGAWTQAQKGYYLKIATLSLESRDNFDFGGNKVQKPGMGKLSDFNVSLYAEYGLTDRLTLVGTVPYKRLSDTRTFTGGIGTEKVSAFGDLQARLRLKLRDDPLLVSAALGGKIPLGYKIRQNSNVPVGTGKLDGDLRLLVGRSLYPLPLYLNGEIGYRTRGGGFSDELFYTLEAGYTIGPWLLKGYAAGMRTTGQCGDLSQASLLGDQNILKLSPGLVYRLWPRLELSLELIHISSGCNTTAGNTLAAGVALKP